MKKIWGNFFGRLIIEFSIFIFRICLRNFTEKILDITQEGNSEMPQKILRKKI